MLAPNVYCFYHPRAAFTSVSEGACHLTTLQSMHKSMALRYVSILPKYTHVSGGRMCLLDYDIIRLSACIW